MDVAPYMTVKPAPWALFEGLSARADLPRFMVPNEAGGFRPVSWRSFATLVRRAARFLEDVGLARGERAAIYAPNSVEWMAAAMAIQSSGGVVVPIYAGSTAAQASFILRHARARVLFTDGAASWARAAAHPEALTSLLAVVTMADRAPAPTGTPAEPPSPARWTWEAMQARGAALEASTPARFEALLGAIGLDDVAELLYTSGTSGDPKGVPLTHRNVGVNGRDWLVCNGPLLEVGDIDLLWLPMSHIFGFGEACLGNTLGWMTYLSSPMAVLAHLPIVKPNVFMSVPAVWEKLAQAAATCERLPERVAALHAATGGNLRFCLSGGAGLKREVKELFHAAGLLLLEGYGLTETSPTLTLNRPGAFRFDSVGQPLPSVELRLADDGEILARGPSVFAGYHEDAAASEAAFTPDGWFKTGDVGRFLDGGFLQIVDRKKDILVTAGGKNVAPVNIEQRFKDDPYIAAVVLYGDGKRYLVAGVWLHASAVESELDRTGAPAGDGRSEARRALVQSRIEAVNAQLASYETIKRFAIIDEPLTVEAGFLTATLKLRRRQLYAAFGPRLEALYT